MGHGQGYLLLFTTFFPSKEVKFPHTPPKTASNHAQKKNPSSIKHEKYSRPSISVSRVIKAEFTNNTNYIRLLKNNVVALLVIHFFSAKKNVAAFLVL